MRKRGRKTYFSLRGPRHRKFCVTRSRDVPAEVRVDISTTFQHSMDAMGCGKTSYEYWRGVARHKSNAVPAAYCIRHSMVHLRFSHSREHTCLYARTKDCRTPWFSNVTHFAASPLVLYDWNEDYNWNEDPTRTLWSSSDPHVAVSTPDMYDWDEDSARTDSN